MERRVPAVRVRPENDAPVRPDRDFVLYWMTAARRPSFNFALDRTVERARELGRPIVVLEAIRAGYEHASARHTRFVLDGMRDNARAFAAAPVLYHPWVEPEPGAGRGLLAALAARACVVVTDLSPAFFLPRMRRAAAARLDVRLEAVDGNGLYPLFAADGIFPTAYSFRRHLHRNLAPHLRTMPKSRPFAGLDLPAPPTLDDAVRERWPAAAPELLAGDASALRALPIDHTVPPVAVSGGRSAARRRLTSFVAEGLARYAEEAGEPGADATSRLSPYLHYGHVSAHEVFDAVTAPSGFDPAAVNPKAGGKRRGYWGLPESVEAFLDQLVTWREVGFHTAAKMEAYDRYESLPGWALATLADHADDEREHVYDEETLERAGTHDELWNAAQTELVREGRIHNYLRMLWGKKILKWSRSPKEALRTMLRLNDRFALDGRDPSSVSGIFWCLGRYDRAWGPERPVFGKVRTMTSANTRRKKKVQTYLATYRPEPAGERA